MGGGTQKGRVFFVESLYTVLIMSFPLRYVGLMGVKSQLQLNRGNKAKMYLHGVDCTISLCNTHGWL